MYYLGIDSGGTKAAFLLADETGRVYARCRLPGCTVQGRRVVEAFTKQADGRAEKTPLYYLFREKFQFAGDDVFNVYKLNREVVRGGEGLPELQMLLMEAWKAGDPKAREIYGMAADELVLGVEAAAGKLGMENTAFPVSYSGGLFKAGLCILEPLREKLDSRGRVLTEPVYEPDAGAVLMAIRRLVPDYDVKQFILKEE